jgi:hypothetical protein
MATDITSGAGSRGASKKSSGNVFSGALHFVEHAVNFGVKGVTAGFRGAATSAMYTPVTFSPAPIQPVLTKIVAFKDPNIKKVVGKPKPGPTAKTKIDTTTATQPPTPIQVDPDKSCSWNLPPHKWSLPVDPSQVYDTVNTYSSDLHSMRRGRIFVGMKYNGNATTTTNQKAATGKKTPTGDSHFNNNYGFQFLWNPETFTQSTHVNWGVTPDQNDVAALLTGLVASNSSINFTIRIDRSNDFACSKSLFKSGGKLSDIVVDARTELLSSFAQNYTEGQAPNSEADFSANINEKIKDLLTRGTEADLEYLYRTINGDGYSLLGVNTSNISFLKPTIVRLDLGPQRLVGMVQGVDVSHLAFTRDMIPIRTDVTLSIDLRTAASLSTNNFNATPDQVASAGIGTGR